MIKNLMDIKCFMSVCCAMLVKVETQLPNLTPFIIKFTVESKENKMMWYWNISYQGSIVKTRSLHQNSIVYSFYTNGKQHGFP